MLYELPTFKYAAAESVQEAVLWLEKFGDGARVIAGGTDLLGLMKDRLEGPQLSVPKVLINIKTIPEMNQITVDDESGLRIGAAVKLKQLETSEGIRKKFGILLQAARQIGTTQIRNMGTVGGNLCQRPQCLYFRHPDFVCYKKGGSRCYAVNGQHRFDHAVMNYGKCVAAHPSDMAPALIALKADIVIESAKGKKKVPLQDFFVGPNNYTETILRSGELLVEIQVPNKTHNTNQIFLKHRIRHASDFALTSVAAVTEVSGGKVKDIRIVLGGIAPLPYVVAGAVEMVRGKSLDAKLISRLAQAAVEGARPLAGNSYKVDLAKAMVKRALGLIH